MGPWVISMGPQIQGPIARSKSKREGLIAYSKTRKTKRRSVWEEAKEKIIKKQGRNSTSRKGILFDSLYHRTKTAEKHSALLLARASPTANSAIIGISDIWSRDHEIFLLLDISLQ
jgi:hypothetical protein